jgi:hypothetical protein
MNIFRTKFYVMNQTSEQNPKSTLNILKIIHAGLIFSPLILFLVIYNVRDQIDFIHDDYYQILIIVIPVFAGFTLLLSSIIGKKQLASLEHSLPLSRKLNSYTGIFIMRAAPKEFGTFVLAIGYALTGGEAFLAIGALMITTLFFDRPTASKMKNELNLSEQEYRTLIN